MRTSPMSRLVALALAALMLLPLASCGTPTETPVDSADTTASSRPDGDGNVESENRDYECDLPDDLNFDETEINILYIKAPGRADELISEKMGAGTVSDAVFERNSIVETKLGVKLNFIPEDDDVPGQATVKNTITGGDNSLDILTLGTNWSMSCAIGGCYRNLNEVEYIDLEKHYWSQDYNNMMTFTSDKKQFLATSPAAISLFRLTYLTIYNRDFFADRGMEDLYTVVAGGEWTLEYQRNLITGIWEDRDGNNTPDADDFYGFVTGTCISIDAYPVTSGITLIDTDEDGYLKYNEDQMDKMIDMSEKVSALYTDKGTYCFPQSEQDRIGLNNIMGKFARAEALMVTTQFLSMETNIDALAAMNYGIVPMPKLSTEQKEYRTYVQDQVTSFGISATVIKEDRLSMLGAVMEAIAYYSNIKVRPAYYDSTLSLRFMQDPESRAILDTMFETIAFDYCFAVGVGGIRDDLRVRLSTATPALASRAQAWKRGVGRILEKDNASLDKLS